MTTKKRDHKTTEPRRSSAQPKPQNETTDTPANVTRADTPEKGEEPIGASPWNDRRYEDE